MVDAGQTAVREALGWLEREASRAAGHGNEAFPRPAPLGIPSGRRMARIRILPATGVVAATFRHRTSRAGDPLLHWHVLVANLVEGPDGRWSALARPSFYRAVRAAGEVFQTVLRAELTERLGRRVAVRTPRSRGRRCPPSAVRLVLEAIAGDRGLARGNRHPR